MSTEGLANNHSIITPALEKCLIIETKEVFPLSSPMSDSSSDCESLPDSEKTSPSSTKKPKSTPKWTKYLESKFRKYAPKSSVSSAALLLVDKYCPSGLPVPASRITAQKGRRIAARHRMRSAFIEGECAAVEFGLVDDRLACMVIVDFTLTFQPDHTIEWAQLSFRFGSDGEFDQQQHDDTENSALSRIFLPKELTGTISTTQEIKTAAPNIGLEAVGCKANIGGLSIQQTCQRRKQWRVQGSTEQGVVDGAYDTFRWNVLQNSKSEDAVPREFRVGMVVFADHGLWVESTIDGGLRGADFEAIGRTKSNQKMGFQIPDRTASLKVLTKASVEKWVSSANEQIVDVEMPVRTRVTNARQAADETALKGTALLVVPGGVGVEVDPPKTTPAGSNAGVGAQMTSEANLVQIEEAVETQLLLIG